MKKLYWIPILLILFLLNNLGLSQNNQENTPPKLHYVKTIKKIYVYRQKVRLLGR